MTRCPVSRSGANGSRQRRRSSLWRSCGASSPRPPRPPGRIFNWTHRLSGGPRWTSGIAWIPGKGNSLKGAHKVNLETLETIARNFLPRVAGMMGVDPKSLVLNVGRSGQPAGHLWFVDFDVVRDGMKIEGARVVFRVNNGNLIQFGTENLPV